MAASGRGALLSTSASLASLIAALSCCLPLGTLLMAAGSAGASLFAETLRPWLVWISAGFLVLAFVQTYFRTRCEFRSRRLRTILLWFSAAFVLATLLAPRFTSSVLAGHFPRFTAASQLRPFSRDEFVKAFESAPDEQRLVRLLSPT